MLDTQQKGEENMGIAVIAFALAGMAFLIKDKPKTAMVCFVIGTICGVIQVML
jgi:hypothetical protein